MPNISLVGKAIEGDEDPYWLNLFANDSRWNAGEPGGTSVISSTKIGKWVYKPAPDKGVYANDVAGKVVFFSQSRPLIRDGRRRR